MEPTPLDFNRLNELQALVKFCHPTRAVKPAVWYFSHPTIVLDSESGYIGYTSFSIGYGAGLTMHLMDTGVRTDFRGKGLAKQLMIERLTIAKTLNVQTLIGATQPDNKAMRRILESLGFHGCQNVPNYYNDETPARDGIIYSAGLSSIIFPEG